MSILNKREQTNNKKTYLLSDKLSFSVQEAYRSLRTSITFALPGEGCKCIGITSATPGEGKSTTSANLAISLGQIGKRVVLVDCDMRLPTTAAKFRVAAVPGLSDFLAGHSPIEDAMRNLERYSIHLLPAGNIPPEPTALLEAKQLERLFTALRMNYDYVIVDLPPVITMPDAMILAKYLDGYLLVVREKRTEHRAIKEMIRRLRMAEAKILGFVATGTSTSDKKYKYKYSNKYYRYSYRRSGGYNKR